MKHEQQKHRLPAGVVRKLRENQGGGTHRSEKQYDRNREKRAFEKRVREEY